VVRVVVTFKRTVSGLLADGRDRLATELVLARSVTVGAENPTVTQWCHSHAIPTTESGASWRQLTEGRDGERNQERQRGETDVTDTHAQELRWDGNVENRDYYNISSESNRSRFVIMGL
jgi:hypothetical protein